MTCFPALGRVGRLMNLSLDLGVRKELSDFRTQMTKEMRQKFLQNPDGRLPVDRMRIEFGNVDFRFSSSAANAVAPEDGGDPKCFREVKPNFSGLLEIEQGQFVCLVGSSGGGKSTLLKILGGEMLPRVQDFSSKPGGCFFVPSHLRVLRVSSKPLFIVASLLENLTFGIAPGDDDGRWQRVSLMCQKLRVSSDIMRELDSGSVQPWAEVFSQAQCQLLSLIR